MTQIDRSHFSGDQGRHAYPDVVNEPDPQPGVDPGEILRITNKEDFDDLLKAIREMGGGGSQKLLEPAEGRDWTDVDVKSMYGVEETANGWRIKQIPDADGNLYSVTFERGPNGGFIEKAFRIGDNGELHEVKEPFTAVPIMRAADLIHRVAESQAVLANADISDDQRAILNQLVEKISAGDHNLDQLIEDFVGEKTPFKDFADMLKAAVTVKGVDASIQYQQSEDAQELSVTFPGEDAPGLIYTNHNWK